MTASYKNRLLPQVLRYFLLVSLMLSLFACIRSEVKGYLYVAAPQAGSYELYSMSGDSTLQFVAEHIGNYNENMPLPPGRYLLLADCSHHIVHIYADETSRLIAHRVDFPPPHSPQKGDLFTIQCSRYEKSHLRQQLQNRFSLFLVDEAQELLVGMMRLKITFPQQQPGESASPQVLSFPLAALRVTAEPALNVGEASYFVSPGKSQLAITQAQGISRWQYFLPGDYQLDLNGSTMPITLAAGESKSIAAAGIRLATSPKWNAEVYTQIKGSPFHVEFNEGHMLLPDHTYPVLPGKGQLSLVGESVPKSVEFISDQVTEVALHSVQVNSGCSPWQWDCLGKREVALFRDGEQYPFLESITDVSIPFFAGDISIGVEGSTGLRYHINANERDTVVALGKLVFIPQGQYKPGHLTDLVRLEALSSPFLGYSYDIAPDGPSTMTLIAGTYNLNRFYTANSFDGGRTQVNQKVTVRPGGIDTVEVPYYLSEAKAKVLAGKMSKWAAKRNRHNSDLLRKREVVEVF
jgi:hypothetical protein